jgi:putative oxidoreductase
VPDVREAGDLQLLREAPARQRIDVFFNWFPRVALAAAFLMIGRSKFSAHSVYVRIFEQIGFGVWFRYFTGALQIVGSILVLIPRTFPVGIALIGCTMLGAMLAWIFFLGSPGTAVIPGVILAIVLAIGWRGRRP